MAGYTRQSVADIIANAVVKAAPINAEYNALRDAFAASTGHKHDGSTGEGGFVPLIADADGNNKVVVDTANNRISVFVEVGGSPVEQLRIQDGVIVPVTDNDIDLGTSTLEFKNLFIDGIAKIDTLTIDENATVGGTLGVTGTTTLSNLVVSNSASVSGTSTLTTVDINGGTIDGTTIGASSAAAGSFTTVTTSGQATLASADINGGTIDGAVIGGSSAAAVTGTTITANTGFVGPLTGAVTGNVTGNLTGNVTGNVTGDLTGNVTASSGTSSFNNVTINGGLDMNAGTSATITNLSTPVNAGDAATKGYVDTSISNLIDSAPSTLDTLNELAAALGDDPNFATTITNSIATKLPLAGGTMSGAIAMGTNKITGLGDPTANQDAATKAYVDTQDATKLSLSGGTMTGAIDMGANKITTTYTPTDNADLTTKTYVDSILGSATSAAASAAAAATSASNAATSETNAANSASAAAASYDSFDDRYLGPKTSAPTLDNDGDALLTGALYWNTTSNKLFVWDGSVWNGAAFDVDTALFDADIGVTVQAWDANLDGIDQGLATTDSPSFAGLTATTADINGGTIDNTVIGGTTPAAGTFSTATVNGNITVTGTVDGRDIAADGSKLDGIEAGADVTDTANVTAAGALMDSELTNITAVKALDQGVATTDSPTFANITSGGVYLGGTGAANLLDDYEEGSWTPTVVTGTFNFGPAVGSYTKIGNRVFATCYLAGTTSTGTLIGIGGLPFISRVAYDHACHITDQAFSSNYYVSSLLQSSDTSAYFKMSTSWSADEIKASFEYTTDA